MSKGALFHPNHSTYLIVEKWPLSYSVGQSLIALGKLYQNIKKMFKPLIQVFYF